MLLSSSRLLEYFVFVFVSSGYYQVDGSRGFGDTEQDWGHVTVRPDAHMFWWLFYSTASDTNYTQHPLMVWIQGGPGMPSSGYGVFAEIGPQDVFLNKREHTWIKDFNVLFIDSPVGVGFSYFDGEPTFSSTNEDIGKDLVKFMEIFLSEHTEFENVPLYLFGESYGGKVVVEFAYQLILRKRKNKINCNLVGIGLGDAYISPLDYTAFYAPVAYYLGLIDKKTHNLLEEKVDEFRRLIESENYEEAYDLDGEISTTIERLIPGVDWYNIVERKNATSYPSLWENANEMSELLNERVKPALNISPEITWDFLSASNYRSLKLDFLKSVTDRIETLLNSTDIKVIVYNGVLDLIVSTAGTAAWIDKLNWKQSEEWSNAKQVSFTIDGVTEGFKKETGNLIFYIILRAGHSIPIDNPVAMDYILTPLK